MCFTIKEIQTVLRAADKTDAVLAMLEKTFHKKLDEINKQLTKLHNTKEEFSERLTILMQHSDKKISDVIKNPGILDQ